jgi:cytochrome c biogenesis protein CcdA
MLFAYLSGILSVLTPCTIVLLPIFLYRFGINRSDSKVLFKDLILVTIGFILGVAGVSIFMHFVVASDYASIIRTIIGMLLIVLGVLHLFGKYNVSFMKNDLHPIWWGLLLPWSISLSPCVMPIFSSFLSVSIVSGKVWLKIIFFALGLISPAIIIAIIGNKAMNILSKSSEFMATIEKYSGILLVLSGIYLNFQMMRFKTFDLIIVTVFFVLMMAAVTFALYKSDKLFSFGGISFVTSLLVLLTLVITNCKNNIFENGFNKDQNVRHGQEYEQHQGEMQCAADKGLDCEICKRCAVLFSVSALSGVGGYILVESPYKIEVEKNKLRIVKQKKEGS